MKNISFYENVSIKAHLVRRLILLFILLLPPQICFANNNLSTLQNEIKKNKSTQTQQNKKRQALENSVATLEQQTAAAALQVEETVQAINAEKKRLKNLQSQTNTLEAEKFKQQKLLEQQLTTAYMTGQNDLIKLLLNQEDLSQIIRARSYYFYLNKARLESIDALQKAQQQLDQNEQDQNTSLAALEAMYKQQKTIKEQLLKQSTARSKALQALNQDLSYQRARLAQLNHAESRLQAQLKKQQNERKKRELAAQKALKEKAIKEKKIRKKKEQTYTSINKQKGQLDWPIRGHVLAAFGSQRSSQVKWKGISIAANEGEKVRAVATGRVLFAGYFKGYGMVIALDHSDDYITLYGYNQALLQKTGDIVLQGDAIALAGHSGGQDINSLYFEISHKGKAQNPLKWLTKRR